MANNKFKNKENLDHFQNLQDFLKERKIERGKEYSHTSLGDPKGSYLIDPKDKEKFFDLYKKGIKQGKEIYLSESHRNQGPILLDLDIKYPKEKDLQGKRVYDDFLSAFIRIYNEIILQYLLPEEDEFLVFFFEKSEPTDKGTFYKDGIHLMYPKICASNKLQYVMRNELVNKINEVQLFEGLGFINKTEDIIDKAVIETNNWMMYGSQKPEVPPYLLKKVYNYELKIIDKAAYENDMIYEFLSIRKFGKEDLTDLKDDWNEKKILEAYEKLNKKRIMIGKKQYTIQNNQEDIKFAKELTDLLKPDRAIAYESWLHLGFCLHNIDYCLLETWIEFSKLAPINFKDGECEKQWEKFRPNNFTLGSLHRWAREDNPDKYSAYLMTKIEEAIVESIDGSSYSVAKAFYKMYRFIYICSDIKNNNWYEYRNHRWVECEGGHTIFNKLNEEMANQYDKLKKALFVKSMLPNITQKEAEELLKQKRQVEKIHEKILNVSFKNNIITECKSMFFDPTFSSRVNENKYVLVFNNGVYDFKEHQFRDGLPEDVMSFTTGINYIKYDENNQSIKEIGAYFNSIMPNDDMKKYVLDLLSSTLVGNIPDEKFHIWTGNGCHAKGTKILMYDGNYRNVEDIQVEECIMGDDSKKRIVKELFSGRAMMYRINQEDFNSSYVVNEDHVLSFRIINSKYLADLYKNRLINIYLIDGFYYIDLKVSEYLSLDDKYKKILYGYKKPILDNHHYNDDFIKKRTNEFDIDENLYKNTRTLRLNKRMTIIDSLIEESTHIKIDKYNDLIVDEINKLCHSVGYHTVIYKDIMKIYKTCIPLSKITIEKLEEDDYYGFEITGNHRYMLEDGTITHNSNGKSITAEMLHLALNDYAVEVQITLLTRKRADATTANPELARTKGKRFVVFQEPENTDVLQVGYIKSLTGGAKITTRTLHERTFEFEPQFKMFLLCNQVPDIPSNDGGTWRRIRVAPWEMKFVDTPKKDNERKKDKTLRDKIKNENWKEGLISFLINHYEKNVKGESIVEPQKVLMYTQMYQDKSDIYQHFINDRLEFTTNQRDKLSWAKLYEEFKAWFHTSRNIKTTIKSGEFKIEMIEKVPKLAENVHGVKFKQEKEPINNGIINDDDDDGGEHGGEKVEHADGYA